MTINIIAPNLPLAECWAIKHNYSKFIYVTDEAQVRRDCPVVILSNTFPFSKEKKRLIEEVRQHHTRIRYVNDPRLKPGA